MDSAKRYIDKDDAFFLHRINCLDLYLKCGITTFVEEFEPNFHDMTLIQYAIAKRKPKTLKDMLETSYIQCQVPFDKIISPETSNTKGNLLSLAIEFGSENKNYGEQYNNVDLECLKVIIEFGKKLKEQYNEKFDIDIENINGETPLISAINHQNSKACQLLIQNGADILHKCNDYLQSPIRCLFKKAETYTILQDIILQDLLMDKYEPVYALCKEIKDSENPVPDLANENTKKFFDEFFDGLPPPQLIKPPPPPIQPLPQPPLPDEKRCCGCNRVLKLDEIHVCRCEKEFCADCLLEHEKVCTF